MMNRRQLLKLLAMGVIGHELDIDRLLWIPGQKTIFLPTTGISYAATLRIEMEKILPLLGNLYNSNAAFYRAIVDIQ